MRDVLDQVERWLAAGQDVALATVVRTWGSAPRPLGSKMAISAAGEICGSVSGGCVEAAVAGDAGGVLATGAPRLLRYGVSQEQAWEVGLSCGGTLEVFVEPFRPIHQALGRAIAAERVAVLATIVEGPGLGRQLLIDTTENTGDLGDAGLNGFAATRGAELRRHHAAERVERTIGDDTVGLFLETHGPRPQLVVVGAVHLAIPLVRFAGALGYRTVVVDPRSAFATPERFGHADELIVEWPAQAFARVGLNETTAIAVLSHDLKIDVPALELAVNSPARYIGALGSRKTHARRAAALEQAGCTADQLARIHAPIGLDLGGRRAEEIAIAVIAEIVAVSHGVRP